MLSIKDLLLFFLLLLLLLLLFSTRTLSHILTLTHAHLHICFDGLCLLQITQLELESELELGCNQNCQNSFEMLGI